MDKHGNNPSQGRRSLVFGVAEDPVIEMKTIVELCNDNPERRAFWREKKVFITGATGMLGSWMTHALVNAGASVTILVRDWVSNSLLFQGDTINHVNIVHGELQNYGLIERTLAEYEIEYIFHLGAQTQVRTALRNPKATFESNILGTWNVLEAARITPTIKGVIVASSDKAYGTQPVLPYTEDASLHGEYPYDVSKSCADLLARSYYLTYGVPVCVTRCGNLYGPGDRNFDRIIPGTIRSIALGEQPVIRSDGKFVRDYFFTPDAVDGYLTIAENMHRPEIVGQGFNLSTMNKVNVLDLFNSIIELMGADVKPKILNQATNEIREQYLSSQKAEKLLNWRPKHTLDEGLSITITWYQQYFAFKMERDKLMRSKA